MESHPIVSDGNKQRDNDDSKKDNMPDEQEYQLIETVPDYLPDVVK